MQHNNLASYAVCEENSKGRLHQELSDDSIYRSIFGRDRDRVINSSAFRRLQYKTQVFSNYTITHLGDHYRTRLTHSLEVAQIARWIAGALNVNKDLAEVISLAHDLGHAPFGHAGEDALNDKLLEISKRYNFKKNLYFSHNEHALKILTKIETRFIEFEGLNLSWEMLEGVAKHNGPFFESDDNSYILQYNAHHDLDLHHYSSLEAQISAISDDIAYNNHDIEDGLRAELFDISDLIKLPLIGEIYQNILQQYPNIRRELLVGEAKKRLTLTMVLDVIEQVKFNIKEYNIKSLDDVRNFNKSLVNFSVEIELAHQAIKKFLMQNMYRHSLVNRMTAVAKKIIFSLFDFYFYNPHCLPTDYRQNLEKNSDKENLAMAICDYIAGMTDRYAIREYEELKL